jgi:hypothetical protein
MTPDMEKRLDYYTVTAERDSGFWIGVPVNTGMTVARDEWLRLMEEDPGHFQLVSLTAEGLTNYSTAPEDVLERAVFVTWLGEQLQ